MRIAFIFLVLFLPASVFTMLASAQTCTGSLGAPVVNETFGNGKIYGIGPALPNGVTNMSYFADNCAGPDTDEPQGEYTIATSMGGSCKGGTWKYIAHDHTGDPNGYFMIINAAEAPSVFFTEKVSGSKLCPNTNYFFGAYVLNILRDIPQTQGYIAPNITFIVETAAGKVLKTINTGDIKADDNPVTNDSWLLFGALFTTPADGPDLVVKIINNAPGGNGNDLALDDITFSPCGPIIQRGFGTITDHADRNTCSNDNLNYTLVASQTGYPDPSYQWQRNTNDGSGWVNIPNANSTSYIVTIPKAQVGEYQYRIGVLSSASVGSENCRIYSDPLNINVYPAPSFPLPHNTAACAGHAIQLNATGGTTYLWTGPNDFSSVQSSPLVTYNATAGNNGDYTVRITQNDCPFFATTTVKVYEPATISPLDNVTICGGSATQLSVKSTNATNFKWYPATGLDHDNISNPIASPLSTTTYTVYVSNDGCPDIAPNTPVTVTVNKKPVASAGNTIRMFEGQKTALAGSAAGDKVITYWTPATYLDNPSSLTPVTSAPANITYTLHVESTVGCGQSTSSVFVRVYKKLTVVNAFTPNGDGINDFWEIKNLDDYPNADIYVYDRYGQKVYQSSGYNKPWDGNFNGKRLPGGTYYYMIDLKDDTLAKQAGWVVIIR